MEGAIQLVVAIEPQSGGLQVVDWVFEDGVWQFVHQPVLNACAAGFWRRAL